MSKDIHILSVGWRSHWLCKELTRLGCSVYLYDLSDALGFKEIEDVNGPFLINKGQATSIDFIHAQGMDLKESLSGFCLSYGGRNLSWASENIDFVLGDLKTSFFDKVEPTTAFWMEDFFKSFARSRFKKSELWQNDKYPYNPKDMFFSRTDSREALTQSFLDLEEIGVQVQKVDAKDLVSILSTIKTEFKSWVLSLTVSELKILTGREVSNLEGSLGWRRMRYNLKNPELFESLPNWSVYIGSEFKPWKSENQVILNKNIKRGFLDFWSIESVYTDPLNEASYEKGLNWLQKQFEFGAFDYEISDSFSGPLKTLFPVSSGFAEINDNLYYWNSPREWHGYDYNSIFEYQSKLLSKINEAGRGKNDRTI